jgi:tetratricopeptide (TPR) repeat protein
MTNERFTNPFPGLRPFESNEDHLFFGRDGQSDELLRRLRQSRFLAVLGTSGSGKSSLVRAGMLPSLFGGLMTQAGSGWRVALFRPGQDPIGHLASSLASSQIFGTSGDDAALQKTIIEATLRRSALGLVEATRQARIPTNENLLIVVDQFEEIFRFRRLSKRDGFEDEAAAFIKLLLEAKRHTEVPIYIVITMRSDFLGDCAQFRDLPEAINDGQYLIPRMTRDQRREAITGPVAVGGGEISPRLVNRLLNDVGDDPDHLPILQHALMRTWDLWSNDRRNGEPIDLRHYEGVGTMADALSRHADEAYAELPDDRSRALAEKVFKSLTEKGPDNREIRRPTRVSEICAIAAASVAEVVAVIEPFRRAGRSFLMPPESVSLTEDSLIDISHESLIRGWERLRKWVDQEARSANIYRRIAETALLHRQGHAGLWHDPDLALALRWREENRPNAVWAQHYHPEFEEAMKFIDDSKASNEAEIAERERARKREVRRTRIFATVFGVLFVIAAGFGVFAVDARNKAYAAQKDAINQRDQAEVARRDAVEQRKKAEVATTDAQRSAEVAESEKQKAEEAAKVADEQRRAAEAATERARAAEVVANQQREEAVRSAEESLRAAMRVRKQSLNDKSSINALAERLIELAPPEEAAYWRNTYATSLAEIGRSDLSKAESSKVLSVFGDNRDALTNRGYMSLIRFETEDALKDFKKIRDLDPQYSLNYLNLGVTQANLKDYSGAANAIEDAIKWYRPGYFDGVFDSEVSDDIKQATRRNVIYADGNEFNSALFYELASIEAFRGGRDFEARLARADENAKSSSSSTEGYLTALNWAWLQLRKQPRDYGAWAVQAHLWRKAGYNDWARYYFQKFECDHAEYKDARYDALNEWVKREMRTLPKSRVAINCDTPPEVKRDTRTKIFEADELASIGKYREAVALLDPEVERDPTNIDLIFARARHRRSAGYWAGYWHEDEDQKKFYAGAREDFLSALKLAEAKPGYQPILSLFWGFVGPELANMDAAEKQRYLEKSIENGPADSGALAELSSMVQKTDPAKAIDLLKRSLNLSPNSDNYYHLAMLQNQERQYRDALSAIELALGLQRESPSYFEDREKYYQERERAEAGGGVNEIQRKKDLAEGYMELADKRLRALKTSDASEQQKQSAEVKRLFHAAQSILTELNQRATSPAIVADLAVIKAKLWEAEPSNK